MNVKRNTIKLTEATLDQQVAANAVDKKIHDYSDITTVLDMAYKENMRQRRAQMMAIKLGKDFEFKEYVNILLMGQPGVGKTAEVNAWCRSKGLRIVKEDVSALDTMAVVAPNPNDPDYAHQLGSNQFDPLDNGEGLAVLFLDEYNRGRADLRGQLLKVVNEHITFDPKAPGKMRFLKDLLFTVAAVNPNKDGNASGIYADPLDAAERSRFYIFNVIPKNSHQLSYLKKHFTDQIEMYKEVLNSGTWEEYGYESEEELVTDINEYEGRLALAERILNSQDFVFDDDADEAESLQDQTNVLNPRSLTRTLEACDGTKQSLIAVWEGNCSSRKLNIIKSILADYKDNIANRTILKGAATPFKKREDNTSDIYNKYKKSNGF